MRKSTHLKISILIIILASSFLLPVTSSLLRQAGKSKTVEIEPEIAESCAKPCLNGGICSDGLCYCTDNYSGEYCQTKFTGSFIDQKVAIAVCIGCVLLGSCCVWCGVSGYQRMAKGPDQPIIRTREIYYEAA